MLAIGVPLCSLAGSVCLDAGGRRAARLAVGDAGPSRIVGGAADAAGEHSTAVWAGQVVDLVSQVVDDLQDAGLEECCAVAADLPAQLVAGQHADADVEDLECGVSVVAEL